jgi:hypothetical protein
LDGKVQTKSPLHTRNKGTADCRQVMVECGRASRMLDLESLADGSQVQHHFSGVPEAAQRLVHLTWRSSGRRDRRFLRQSCFAEGRDLALHHLLIAIEV